MALSQESFVTVALATLPQEFLSLAHNLSCFVPKRLVQWVLSNLPQKRFLVNPITG